MSWLIFSHAASVVVGSLVTWAVYGERLLRARVAARAARVLNARAESRLRRIETERCELVRQTALLQSHVPRMHEMAMALNKIDDVCSCEDCQQYRAQREGGVQ